MLPELKPNRLAPVLSDEISKKKKGAKYYEKLMESSPKCLVQVLVTNLSVRYYFEMASYRI